jgi:heat-inducible transcriptional repressor
MDRIRLSKRESLIHKKIVQRFIATATPVSSRIVAQDRQLQVSPATIRATMARLEELGLIRQPHTSAGRVPTDHGYRYYVDSLMDQELLTDENREAIECHLQKTAADVNAIMEQACLTLGLVSRQLGIALSPRFLKGIFQKLELYPVAEQKVLMVLTIKSGLVRTVVARITSHLSPRELEETARIISERLYGLSLQQIRDCLPQRIGQSSGAHPQLVKVLVHSLDQLFDFSVPDRIYWKGTDNLVAQPEFTRPGMLEGFFGFLEDSAAVRETIRRMLDNESIQIRIGQENRLENMTHCSMVVAPYRIGQLNGAVGVIGPTRMEYSRVVAAAGYVAKLVGRLLTA